MDAGAPMGPAGLFGSVQTHLVLRCRHDYDARPDRPPFVIVRRPAASLNDGIVTFREREPIDVERARRQWDAYVKVFADRGWGVVEVPLADDLPDSVFIEDTAVVFGDLAVLTNPGAAARNPEIRALPPVLGGCGYEIARIEGDATLDGGDILKVGTTVYAGLTGTTNAAGVRRLAEIPEPRGYTVVPVPVTKALHLKSAVTALPDGAVIGYGPVVDDPSIFGDYLEVPEEPGAHVVLLDDHTVLMSDRAPRTSAMFAARGLDVVTVDIGEYEKLEGCVTCLSIRARG